MSAKKSRQVKKHNLLLKTRGRLLTRQHWKLVSWPLNRKHHLFNGQNNNGVFIEPQTGEVWLVPIQALRAPSVNPDHLLEIIETS